MVAFAVGLFAVGGVGLFRQLRSTPAPSAPAQTQEISPIQISGSLPQLITSLQQQVRQVPGNAPQQVAPNERIDEQGRRIIRTPFGDIVRDKPNN